MGVAATDSAATMQTAHRSDGFRCDDAGARRSDGFRCDDTAAHRSDGFS